MGRKPNPLILQFFDRGNKLDNSSNRYEHTCRSCGEKFPKGRIDSLTGHLLSKCPGISTKDRDYALQTLNQRSKRQGRDRDFQTSVSALAGTKEQNLPEANHHMSALETLAEVSRHRLDSGERTAHQQNLDLGKRKRDLEDDSTASILFDDLVVPEQSGVLAGETFHGFDASEQISQAALRSVELLSALPIDPQNHAEPTTARLRIPEPSVNNAQFALVENATLTSQPSVNFTVEDFDHNIPASRNESYGIDAQISIPYIGSQRINPINREASSGAEQFSQSPEARSAESRQTPQAPFLNSFSATPGVSRSRPRGRFSDSRRQEVRDIRKQGACIRCRMLKKPCSDGTPCNTCKKLASSRLWKHPCFRTRPIDELQLYSAGVHNAIYFHMKSAIKASSMQTDITSQLYCFHAEENSTTSPLNVKVIKHLLSEAGLSAPNEQELWLPVSHANSQNELEQYVKERAHALVEREPSHCIRITLKLALSILAQTDDDFLERAVDLWNATIILVDPKLLWIVQLAQELVTKGAAESFEKLGLNDHRTYRMNSKGLPEKSYLIVISHLRSCLERICASQAKSLISELERRLLMRAQASQSRFETFLVSVILLNCVERMCWLYRTWITSEKSNGAMQTNPGAEEDSQPTVAVKPCSDRELWHIDQQPQDLVDSGERVTDILVMLLRVRGIPPRSRPDQHGILRAVNTNDESRIAIDATGQEYVLDKRLPESLAEIHKSLPVKTTFGTSTTNSNADDVASLWFNNINVDLEQIRERTQIGEQEWDSEDCRSWDMRFVGRLLLPND